MTRTFSFLLRTLQRRICRNFSRRKRNCVSTYNSIQSKFDFFSSSNSTFNQITTMPGTFSKAFDLVCRHNSCIHIVHPGHSCFRDFLQNIPHTCKGSLKFFLPVCIVPLIIRPSKLKEKETWVKFFKNLLRCFTFGTILVTCILTGFCVML